MSALFSLVLTAYIMSLGLGLLIGGSKGLSKANGYWVKAVTRFLAWGLRSLGDLLHYAARKTRR